MLAKQHEPRKYLKRHEIQHPHVLLLEKDFQVELNEGLVRVPLFFFIGDNSDPRFNLNPVSCPLNDSERNSE